MAKRTVPVAADSWTDVLVAIRKLQEMHALGQELLKKYPIGQTFGQGAMQSEAAKRKTNSDKLYKARVFADAVKGYSPSELKQLFGACKKYRCALGFTFITKFLTVGNKTERKKFQQQVIAEGWSLAQVKLELTRRYGHRRQAGKRPKIGSVDELLTEMGTRSIWWRRLHQLLAPKTDPLIRPWTLTSDDVPEGIREYFVLATEAVCRLDDAIKIHRLAKAAVALQRGESPSRAAGKSLSTANRSKFAEKETGKGKKRLAVQSRQRLTRTRVEAVPVTKHTRGRKRARRSNQGLLEGGGQL